MVGALKYISDHSAQFIQWTAAAIALCTAYIGMRMVLGQDKSNSASDQNKIDELEKSLQRVLEKAALPQVAAMASAGTAAASGAAPAVPVATAAEAGAVSELSHRIADKEKQIADLQKQLKEQNLSGAELDKALEKIRDLEAKLAEYEIIEDDIADLSQYKEENARLKDQIAKLGGAVEDAATEPVSRPAPAKAKAAEPEAAASPEPDLEPQGPVDPAKVIEKQMRDSAITAALAEAGADEFLGAAASEDLVAEFENAVSASKPPLVATEELSAVSMAELETPAVDDEKKQDDILAEFSPEGTAGGEDALINELSESLEGLKEAQAQLNRGSEGDNIDTDRMLAEMDSLVSQDPGASGPSSLEDEMDVDKMAAEASDLASTEKR